MLWDPAQLELITSYELESINIGGSGRAPLVGHFRAVENGAELLIVTNHFWRSEDRYRHEQGTLINQWATEQTLPAITMGDFNFDWIVEGGDDDHDLGYDNMVAEGTWMWVRPEELIMTQCNFNYTSVLDFVFVAGDAQEWAASSDILNTNHSYCRDDDERSDHRAVRADFIIPELVLTDALLVHDGQNGERSRVPNGVLYIHGADNGREGLATHGTKCFP
jgi:endonuclease/exonuclease/phosphatase family metal-dependent hydrolase